MSQHAGHLLANVPMPMSGLCTVISLLCFTNKLSWSLPLYVLNSFLPQCPELGTHGPGRGLFPFGDLLPGASLAPVTLALS
jgi:hypothetical protein